MNNGAARDGQSTPPSKRGMAARCNQGSAKWLPKALQAGETTHHRRTSVQRYDRAQPLKDKATTRG